MSETYLIGMKYQIYEDDELKVYRLIKVKNQDTVTLQDTAGNTKIVSRQELHENYVALENDAFLNCMITTTDDGIPDVYVCINQCSGLASGNNEPSLVLRQNIYSFSKNQLDLASGIYVGECATLASIGQNEKLSDLFEFTKILNKASIAVYINDSMDTMLKLLPPKFLKEVNATLEAIKSLDKNGMIKGTCETLEELMTDNAFIEKYLSTFNVMRVYFPIVLGDESYNSEGDIVLNKKQHGLLEGALGRYISDVKILKYDRDFDISEIVNVTHSMVCDSTGELYLIAYTVDGYLGDGDIATAMGVVGYTS
jgi:hypothetical protein